MSVPLSPVFRLLCLLVLAAAAGVSAARDVAGLYSAEVAVADRSQGELARGAGAALAEVLIKLTGDRRAAGGAAAALRQRAASLLLQYGYKPAPDDGGLLLAAQFDAAALDAELAALEVPVWGKERPDTVLWLVVDDGAGRRLVSGDEPGLYGDAALARAARRGIPVLLPLMDIEESQHLLYAGDWAGLSTAALALAERYGTPASAVGHLRQSAPGLWEARWRIRVGEQEYEWRQEGDLVELVMEDGVDAVADALARRFAAPQLLAGATRIELEVSGVGSAADYARLTRYLEALDTVQDLFVSRLAGDRVQFRVTARGERGALAQSIAFGQVLSPVAGQPGVYRLLP